MTPATMHRARLLLHWLVTARDFGQFEAVAMALGMPRFRTLPPAVWLARLRWRVAMLHALLWTVPYRAGRLRLYGAN